MQIFDGQFIDYIHPDTGERVRSDPVPEEFEDKRGRDGGAFTVANLNDTDGDGIIDNKDKIVKETEVDLKKQKGRDEVDLMKLIINKPVPDEGGEVVLKIVSGKVKLWKESTKDDKEVKAEDMTISTNKLPITYWVEAIDKSKAIRDIELEVSYKGLKDAVLATAVWAEKTKFINSNIGGNNPLDAQGFNKAIPADASNDFRDTMKEVGNQFGSSHVSPWTNNVMVLEFKVFPPNIGSEPQVEFDITRRRESIGWKWNNGVRTDVKHGTLIPSDFPIGIEVPNDDSNNEDEDNTPKNDHIYSVDAPGFETDNASSDREVMRFNFVEFVRVGVGKFTMVNLNGVTIGSRASNEVKWHSRIDVIKNPTNGKWQRNGTDNQIEEGHKALGNAP